MTSNTLELTPDTHTADGFSVYLLQIADCYFGCVRRDDGKCHGWERIDGTAKQYLWNTWGKTRRPLVEIYHDMCR